jgi:hypothetical protein
VRKINRATAFFLMMPFLLLCLGLSDGNGLGWRSFIIAPLSLNKDNGVRFVYRTKAETDDQPYLFRLYLFNGNYQEGLLVFQSTEYGVKGIIKDMSKYAVIPYSYLVNGQNELNFTCLSNGKYDKIMVFSYPRVIRGFFPSENQTSFVTPYNYVELRDGILITKRDSFIFNGFNGIVEDEFYHYLDLSSLSINSENPFVYTKAVLMIPENGPFYNLLPKSKSVGYREIELTILSDQGGRLTMAFSKTLFVEPKTLMMSSVAKDGFVETNQLYFPKEAFESEHDLDLRITISGCGYNGITIHYLFTYYSNKKFLGNCRNSEYCISTSTPSGDVPLEEWEVFST